MGTAEKSIEVTEKSAEQLGISASEWEHLCRALGRTPSLEELQMVGVQWSEHCSYKSSKHQLKKLLQSGSQVLQGPGENAGLVRLDDRRALAFKVESHNHPSFVEPFQGAATGVGGILRDIFTMGARPVALGNYLRFGPLDQKKHQHLLHGVVSGISHYGNCMGIPTLGGQIHSGPSYQGNILVNVFAMGVVDQNKVFYSNTAKPGQSVMVWGAKTGRDGIHGASLLASADFEEGKSVSTEQKIRVQVGDPLKEKCLMEATLECMQKFKSDIGAIQDMGAAGLTCSTLEISDKSKIGMKIDLEKVPVRETEMQAYEILLSESQERMLAVVKKGSEQQFIDTLERWHCDAAVIGESTDDGILRIDYHGKRVVELELEKIMEAPPVDLPKVQTPLPLFDVKKKIEENIQFPEDVPNEWGALKAILSQTRIASKRSVFEQYDSSVGASTVFGPGEAEAAVLGAGSPEHPYMGISFKGACDEALIKRNPRLGMLHAMAECYRSLCCVGAKPLAITDGINLGNPNTEKVQTQLAEAVQGLNEAIEVFDTPCVSGNVSLYNQTKNETGSVDIDPSIFVVMVGRVDDVRKCKPSAFQQEGSEVWMLEAPSASIKSGPTAGFPVGSLYERLFWPESKPYLPAVDLNAERILGDALIEAHEQDLFLSLRDTGDGGLAPALVEACLSSSKALSFEGDWSKSQERRDYLLFSESGGRVIVEIDGSKRAQLMKLAMKFRIDAKRIGSVISGDKFRIRPLMTGSLQELKEMWTKNFNEIF